MMIAVSIVCVAIAVAVARWQRQRWWQNRLRWWEKLPEGSPLWEMTATADGSYAIHPVAESVMQNRKRVAHLIRKQWATHCTTRAEALRGYIVMKERGIPFFLNTGDVLSAIMRTTLCRADEIRILAIWRASDSPEEWRLKWFVPAADTNTVTLPEGFQKVWARKGEVATLQHAGVKYLLTHLGVPAPLEPQQAPVT